jgi:hypothetical protein
MKKFIIFICVILCITLFTGSIAFAEEPQPETQPVVVVDEPKAEEPETPKTSDEMVNEIVDKVSNALAEKEKTATLAQYIEKNKEFIATCISIGIMALTMCITMFVKRGTKVNTLSQIKLFHKMAGENSKVDEAVNALKGTSGELDALKTKVLDQEQTISGLQAEICNLKDFNTNGIKSLADMILKGFNGTTLAQSIKDSILSDHDNITHYEEKE